MRESSVERYPPPRWISIWLTSVCGLILLVVAVGGITRLTGSGLSIVEWRPIMGAVPPLNEADWNAAFAQYRKYPQYRLVNAGMTLGEFKFIFFWEYVHRLLGRLIGLVFGIPLAWILFRRRVERPLNFKLCIALMLGGAQGLMGWMMVKSGLADRPSVSHLRLAAHLSLALAVLGYLYWISLDLWLDFRGAASARRAPPATPGPIGPVSPRLCAGILAFVALVSLQITYGALVAGLKAGYAYATFPKMTGSWIPPEAFALAPFWRNAWDNPAMVQFVHRTLGWAVLTGAFALAITAWRGEQGSTLRRPTGFLLLAVGTQFCLGVSTLLFQVPIGLAVAHQLGGCWVLLASLKLAHRARRAHGKSTPGVDTRSGLFPLA